MESDELHRRLRAAEDRLAIIELEGAYGRTFDGRDGDGWAALFTEDGIYRSRPSDGTGRPAVMVRGREELARFCRESPFTGIHLLHLPQVTLDGDRALSRVHMEFVAAFDDGTSGRTVGFYDVAYHRTDAGWLIERRVTTVFARERRSRAAYPQSSGLDPS